MGKLVPTAPLKRALPYDAYASTLDAIAFDAAGKRVLCTSKTQSIWSVPQTKQLWEGEGVVALHPDGKRAIFTSGGGLVVKAPGSAGGTKIAGRNARVAADGRSLVALTERGAAAWNLATCKPTETFRGDARAVERTADGVLVVVNDTLAVSLVRGKQTSEVRTKLRPSPVRGLQIRGHRALAWNARGDVVLVDIATNAAICVRPALFSGMDRGRALLDDGARVATGEPYEIRDLEANEARPIAKRDPNREQPKTLCALDGGRFAMLVVRPADAYLEIWDARRCLAKTVSCSGVVAAHGDLIAVDRDGAPAIYRLTGRA